MIILSKYIWFIASLFIILISITLSIKLGFPQFNFKKMIQCIRIKDDKKGISNFQTLMVSLAGRIGVGSVAGVSLAIYFGGVGSIFWMIVTVFLTSICTFSETILGGIYKEYDSDYQYKGGPSYYIKKGLKKRNLASLYAILILISYVIFFNAIQSNTISKSLNYNPIIIGIVLSILTLIIISGGLKKISQFSSFIVPIMTILYVFFALITVVLNFDKIPGIIISIIKDAFNPKSFFSGFIVGIQRGIFSNEAGIGTGSIVSSASSKKDIVRQGYIQMLGSYITTFLICLSTACIVLTSNSLDKTYIDVNGIEITKNAFLYHFSNIGNIALIVSIILFSFSTITTSYYYGESSVKYFKNFKNLYILKILTVIIVFLGCIIPSMFLWSIVDIFVALLIIINLYAIYKLRSELISYFKKRS